MKTLRLLTIAFDTEIKAYETVAFRGAVIDKVGVEHEWFHNHNNDPNSDQRYHYRYPLVQYKRKRKQPMLVFIDQGVEEAQHFFMQQNWDMMIGENFHKMSISNMHVKTYQVGVYPETFRYVLRQWQALNDKNYAQYLQLESEEQQIALLKKILANHLISFAKGIQCQLQSRFELHHFRILKERHIKYGGVKVQTFDIAFSTNVLIPPYVGIGKGASRGFGVVTKYQKKNIPTNPLI